VSVKNAQQELVEAAEDVEKNRLDKQASLHVYHPLQETQFYTAAIMTALDECSNRPFNCHRRCISISCGLWLSYLVIIP